MQFNCSYHKFDQIIIDTCSRLTLTLTFAGVLACGFSLIFNRTVHYHDQIPWPSLELDIKNLFLGLDLFLVFNDVAFLQIPTYRSKFVFLRRNENCTETCCVQFPFVKHLKQRIPTYCKIYQNSKSTTVPTIITQVNSNFSCNGINVILQSAIKQLLSRCVARQTQVAC